MTANERKARRIADAAAPKVRAQVARALKSLQDAVPIETLEQILRARDAFALYDLATSLPAKLRPAVATLDKVFRGGAAAGTAQVSGKVGLRWRFDATNPLATQAAREHGARLVTAVTAETRSAIRAVVARAFTEGIPPRDAARLIRPLIGLTERQAEAVASRTMDLIAAGMSRRGAIARGRAYAEQLRGKRALMIARTETIAASTQGQLASWDAAVKRGLLSARSRKVWITTPDDRLCPRCAAMDGKTAQLGGKFQASAFGAGVDGPPLHPNCRCAIGLQAASEGRRKVA